jgi:protein involved in polysaccharide export with SLBB domain
MDFAFRLFASVFAACILVLFAGCLVPRHCPPLETIDPSKVRNACCCDDGEAERINFLMLRLKPPTDYVLGGGDTLGIYIQGITGDKDTPPPVHFPEDPGLQPALGYPVPIRDDGMISLPLIEPIRLSGLTLGQAESRIREAYTKDKEILLEGSDKIIVTLIRRRTVNVLVIREDHTDNREYSFRTNEVFVDDERKGETFSIELPAYENDVLHALSQTGGMPGETAVNEILIVRDGMNLGINSTGAIVTGMDSEFMATTLTGANVTRIPLEAENGVMPQLSETDITLNDGDVIFIEGRKRQVFYTGGLLEGGRFPLPRDYEIDVLEAIALAGGNNGSVPGAQGSIRGGGVLPATRVLILRRANCEFCAVEVDLRCVLSDPKQRVIIRPGDLILLQYRPKEIFVNTVVSIFQFGSIFRLFD